MYEQGEPKVPFLRKKALHEQGKPKVSPVTSFLRLMFFLLGVFKFRVGEYEVP